MRLLFNIPSTVNTTEILFVSASVSPPIPGLVDLTGSRVLSVNPLWSDNGEYLSRVLYPGGCSFLAGLVLARLLLSLAMIASTLKARIGLRKL